MVDFRRPGHICLFYPLYCDTTSLKITKAFHLLHGFAEILTILWDFYNRGCTVVTEILLCLYKQFISYDRAKTEKISNFLCSHG